ncbi:flagellar biosynthetic protein FliO [Psychrobacillus vulpis]|uniref:Flagellar biogenesis protein n=1 Tax=Psychrobacillus vulpis TaxID=2325572 RepID=A0A544TTZ2_9BACI|nr:flagellar biosynthetic protein FliO [Psychrobacillus vulpis]TQR20931.1 flagellar biogenesis protein [Psychrobacillus vulpis]
MKLFQKLSGNEMKRKTTLIYSIICILLIFSFQVEVHAATDPTETVEENLKKLQNKTDKDSTPVIEDEPTTETDIPSEGVSVSVWDYVKIIFALLFVILLLYGLLRFVNSKNRSFQQNQLIQNLGGVGLGQGKSVQLLQAGNSLFLVGIGEDIYLLKEISDPDEIDKLTKIYEDKQDIGKSIPYIAELFSHLKGKNLSKGKNNEKNNSSFNETFQKRLQEIKKDRSDVLNDWKTKEREKNE